MADRDKSLVKVRKLRKKLRQIEHLERLERDLTDEEIYKCMKKDSIRESLLELLTQYSDLDSVPNSSFRETEFSLTSTTISTDYSTCQSQSVLEFSQATVDTETTEADVLSPDHVHIGDIHSDTDTQSKTKSNAQSSKPSQKVESQHHTKTVSSTVPVNNAGGDKASITTKKTEQTTVKPESQKSQPKKTKGTSLESRWQRSGFKVTMLEGHNDLITAVDCCGPYMISASRDTTVKVWDLESFEEIRSLGSHTGSVTDVVTVTAQSLGQIGVNVGVSSSDHIILSGSVDCSLKVWGVDEGLLLRDIYTYNAITKVSFCAALCLAVTASDGGKLELWDIDTKACVSSVTAHQDTITGLCVNGKIVFTSCAVNGEISVYEIRDRVLHCMFVSENIHTAAGTSIDMRPVRSLAVKGDNLYYGDDGLNVKILSWKKGLVTKVTNHKEEFGMTDAICIHDNLMMCSAYDLDNGQGYVNAFDLSETPTYLGTLDTGESGRILDVCFCCSPSNLVTMVTAGIELQIWQQVADASKDEESIKVTMETKIQQPATDSDIESDIEFTSSEDEDERHSRRGSVQSQAISGWGAWCSIV